MPKFEKSLLNTTFERVDWGTGEIFKPVTSFEVIIIEEEEREKILFANLDLLLMPSLKTCTEVFYNKMKHKVNILKIVSLVHLHVKTSEIEEIVDERADTLTVDIFKKFEVTASMEVNKLALLNKVISTIIRSV